MAKQREIELDLEPFPPLSWEQGTWETTVVLPAWKGFQSRLGPYGTKSSKKASDGTARLWIETIDETEMLPSPEQGAAHQYLVDHQEVIRDKILRAVFKEYPEYRTNFIDDLNLDESDVTLPELERPDQLRKVMGLESVGIHYVVRAGLAYVGFEFGCDWDSEHGLGAMTHRARIVEIGGADTAILEWIAERDAKRRRKKK
jgi:hypothetical protein